MYLNDVPEARSCPESRESFSVLNVVLMGQQDVSEALECGAQEDLPRGVKATLKLPTTFMGFAGNKTIHLFMFNNVTII